MKSAQKNDVERRLDVRVLFDRHGTVVNDHMCGPARYHSVSACQPPIGIRYENGGGRPVHAKPLSVTGERPDSSGFVHVMKTVHRIDERHT